MEEPELEIRIKSGTNTLVKEFSGIRDDITMDDIMNHIEKFVEGNDLETLLAM